MPRRRISLYLSHPIWEREWIRNVEKKLERELKVVFVNPFYDIPRTDIESINEGKISPYGRKREYKTIVERDLETIDEVDGLLAFLPYPTIGVSMEIFYAGYILKKPVFVITESQALHPWVRACSKGIYRNLEDFKKAWKRGKCL